MRARRFGRVPVAEGLLDDTTPELVCPACGMRGLEAYCPNDGQRRVLRDAIESGDPLVGKVIDGRYAIERRLGQGGMGAVYVATQLLVERRVVVKVMRADTGYDETIRGRFLREARAASRVTHTNVVTIHDFGYTDDGMAYLVMELVQGPSLADVLDVEERLPWRRAAHIVAQVARALEAAHRVGIVHRDVKPGNVMLARDEGGGEIAKVLDFGVARVLDAGDARLTRSGAVMGTPAYMAPEQAAGREVGPAADVYALGAMLFDLVTGQLPFSGQNITDVLLQHMAARPPTMREVAPEAAAPGAMEVLVRRCLEKRPERRPGSAMEVADELDRIVREDGAGEVQGVLGDEANEAFPLLETGEAAAATRERPLATRTGRPGVAPTGMAAEPPLGTAASAVVAAATAQGLEIATPSANARRGASRWALAVWLVVAAVAVIALILRIGAGDPEPRVAEGESTQAAASGGDVRGADADGGEGRETAKTGVPAAPPAPPPPPAIPAPRGLRLDGLPVEEER